MNESTLYGKILGIGLFVGLAILVGLGLWDSHSIKQSTPLSVDKTFTIDKKGTFTFAGIYENLTYTIKQEKDDNGHVKEEEKEFDTPPPVEFQRFYLYQVHDNGKLSKVDITENFLWSFDNEKNIGYQYYFKAKISEKGTYLLKVTGSPPVDVPIIYFKQRLSLVGAIIFIFIAVGVLSVSAPLMTRYRIPFLR